MAEELGLIELDKRSAISKTLEICKILKESEVDFSNIQLSKKINGKKQYILLKEIEQEGIDIEKIIERKGLDGGFKLGLQIGSLRVASNGKKGSYKITEEEKRLAEELGLIELDKKSAVAETLEICKILKESGVDLSKIQKTKTINGKSKNIILKEIEQEGIDIEKIIKEKGLDGEFKFGQKINALKAQYNGKGSCKITEEEKRLAEELGLIKTKDGQEIGKATYDSSVEECDKADRVLEQLIEKNKDKNKGNVNKYDE